MTIKEIINKILVRWWVTAIFFSLSLAFFFPTLGSHTYKASIGLGANFNSPAFIRSGVETSSQYALAMEQLSKYLGSRFTSVEVQMRVAELAQIPVSDFQLEKPFYEVVKQGGGYISVTFNTKTREEAERFLEATKKVYTDIITTEMAGNHILVDFQIQPQTQFFYQIAEVKAPIQFRIMPLIAGLLTGVLVSIIVPYKKNSKLKNTEKSKTETKVKSKK
jgi:hypothetical protein